MCLCFVLSCFLAFRKVGQQYSVMWNILWLSLFTVKIVSCREKKKSLQFFFFWSKSVFKNMQHYCYDVMICIFMCSHQNSAGSFETFIKINEGACWWSDDEQTGFLWVWAGFYSFSVVIFHCERVAEAEERRQWFNCAFNCSVAQTRRSVCASSHCCPFSSLSSIFVLFVIWLLRRYHSLAQVNLRPSVARWFCFVFCA